MTNVVTMPRIDAAAAGGIPAPPKHFRKAQSEAWADLAHASPAAAANPENRFTLEIAATLMAKFRSGKAMNATETKELKKQLIALGLAKADDDGQPGKPRKNGKYFEGG